MTDPTGRSFLSYRRVRRDEAALLIAAQHDHGIPTWQDINNLGSLPTEDELRRVLADPAIASAILFITPEVETSAIIRNVEIPRIIKRAEQSDGFFVVPLAAGGLDYAKAAEVTSNHLSAQNLADWNMWHVSAAALTAADAARIARVVLTERLQVLHRALPPGDPLRVGLFVRRSPALEPGTSLCLDWSSRFTGKEATPETWHDTLLPALAHLAEAIGQHALGRRVEAFGIPTLPAALALGCAFLSTSGLPISWKQIATGFADQLWDLSAPREPSGFHHRLLSASPSARDLAVLVSIADDTEPVFASCRSSLPPLRAIVRVDKPGSYPHWVATPGRAADIAFAVRDGLRSARREYGDIGVVHLFVAAPAGLAMLIGQLLNTFGAVQTYEHVSADGSGSYRPAALLRPCS